MAKYTNQQLNQIYSYLGFNFYVDFDSEVAQVVAATQAVADGGTQPDTTLQLQVLSIVSTLQTTIDANLQVLSPMAFVVQSAAGSKINPVRADFLLRRQGRALIKQLCIIFGLKGVRSDYYSKGRIIGMEGKDMSFWPGDNS